MKIVKLMIKKGANNWNGGLYSACSNGHMNIVKFMINRGANNWNAGLYAACEDGSFINNDKAIVSKRNCHIKIVKLMIEKGANQCDNCFKSIQDHLLKK
jgi:hypothetical protein